jgi:hypothetical protein
MDVAVTLLVVPCGLGIALSLAALVVSIVRLRRAPDDPGVRFGCVWLGALALLAGPLCCIGVAHGLAGQVSTSRLAMLAVILVNVLAQPVWLLVGYASCRKGVLGLTGRVAYGWRGTIPEDQLRDLPPAKRRSLQRYCITQGLFVLPLAASMSLACVWPLLPLLTR